MFTLKPSPPPSPKGADVFAASATTNRPEAVRKLTEKLGGGKNLKVCCEASPTGHALYWQLTKLGVDCQVIVQSLIP